MIPPVRPRQAGARLRGGALTGAGDGGVRQVGAGQAERESLAGRERPQVKLVGLVDQAGGCRVELDGFDVDTEQLVLDALQVPPVVTPVPVVGADRQVGGAGVADFSRR